MARKKSNLPPKWTYKDNPYSKFTMIHADLVLSPEFQALDHSSQYFYYCCRINAVTEEGWGALEKHTRESNIRMGQDESIDLRYRGDYKNGFFVMPASHMEKYGYSRQQGSKLMKKLVDAGFVEVVERNKHQQKMNVYRFSTKFKNRVKNNLHNQQDVNSETTKNQNVNSEVTNNW